MQDNDNDDPGGITDMKPKRHRRTKKEIYSSTILSLLQGRRKRYTMPRHQAFSKLYYKNHKLAIMDSWKTEVRRLKREDRVIRRLKGKAFTKAITRRRISFTNKALKAFYNGASDDVKDKVEAYRLSAGDDEENQDTRAM